MNEASADHPPTGFRRIDFDRDCPQPTFITSVGTLYARKAEKGTRDHFVIGLRVHANMCDPAGGLHGGVMMTIADLVGSLGGTRITGMATFASTVSMSCEFVASAKVGDWVEGRSVVCATRTLMFSNICLTVGEEKILRASGIHKIPTGDGLPHDWRGLSARDDRRDRISPIAL